MRKKPENSGEGENKIKKERMNVRRRLRKKVKLKQDWDGSMENIFREGKKEIWFGEKKIKLKLRKI